MQDNYGTFVNNYNDYIETGGMEKKVGRDRALEALDVKPGDNVLNFGCHVAVNSLELQAMGATVTGIDVSAESLVVARQLDPNSTYIHYDGVRLAEAVNHKKFDAILASFSFCTIPDEILQPLLHQMRQLLVPGGRLVIVDPNLEKAMGQDYGELKYHAQPGVKSGDHVTVTLGSGETAETIYHDIYRTHRDYYRLLEPAGFTIILMDEPQPEGEDVLKWPKAVEIPPFVRVISRLRSSS